MDRDRPTQVETSVTVGEIGDYLSSIQKWAQSGPVSAKLVDKLAVQLRELGTEIDSLTAKLRTHIKALTEIHTTAHSQHPCSSSRLHHLLRWSHTINQILTDTTLLTPLTTLTTPLHTLIPPLFHPAASHAAPQRLKVAYSSILKSHTTFTHNLTTLTTRLVPLATQTIPHAASLATKDFISDLDANAPPAFTVATRAALSLLHVSVKIPECCGGRVGVLLRVLEGYFNAGCRGLPIMGQGVFEKEEIGAVLAGVVGACIALKVAGGGVEVEGRLKMLKKGLVVMWEREVATVAKARWMSDPERVVRRVKRKETGGDGKRTDEGPVKREQDDLGSGKVPDAKGEADATKKVFEEVPATTGQAREETVSETVPPPDRVSTGVGAEAEGKKKKKRKKGGKKHGGGGNK